ncbi:MAG: FKBP-type peptidyl-prolyl cis-trans isomerase [Planctomycetes bacterium]|nr:FKBP-type peptidyl-prolyl cis-trans isomerase [Planctomycetota bacterium]
MGRRATSAVLCVVLGACSFSGFNRPIAVPPPQEHLTPSGVQYAELLEGHGSTAVYGSLVSIDYTGWLGDGRRFDSTYDRGTPLSFTIGKAEVAKGLEDGVLGLRAGGKRRLTIPPELGWGATGIPDVIPPNSTLVFEIELVQVVGP